MQASSAFTKVISDHLQKVAETDSLFAETLKKPNKNITDCVSYILNTVKASGKNGFADEEVFNMAIHYYDEDDIKNIKTDSNCKVVVNHHVEGNKNQPVSQQVNKKPVKKLAKQEKAASLQISLI
jgi:hypothetical protein